MSTSHDLKKKLGATFEEALVRVPERLATEGFGVLTTIDLKTTLAKKLGVDFRRYVILGACNPPFAHQALEADLDAGLMLPCNVAIYEGDDGKAVVMAVDPTSTVAASGNPALVELAAAVREKLARVVAGL